MLLHCYFLTEYFKNLGHQLSGWMPLALGSGEEEEFVPSEMPGDNPNDMNYTLHQPVPNTVLGVTAF